MKSHWSRRQSLTNRENCPICILTILESQRFQLGCSHAFCKPCISKWLQNKRDCPLCRAVPSEKEIDDLGSKTSTAPADGRVYENGLPMDWTEDRAIFDLVESLHVPSFTWDEVEAQPFSWSGWGLAFWA